MATTVTENLESREYTDGVSAMLSYTIHGTADESAAMADLQTTAPTIFQGLPRQSTRVEPLHVDTGNPAGSVWTGTARFSKVDPPPPPPETGDSSFSFDTGGGTQHITQALSTINSYAPAGQTAPDFKGAISVTQDNVEGVDITVPVYNFSETHYIDDATVTIGYRGTLFSLTGKVNDADFKGLNAGECLFLGAAGSKRGEDDWEITFRFAGLPNVTGLMVGDIGPISKKGWEYLWVRYEDQEDAAANSLVKRPVSAYVEQVYRLGSFGALGIGT